jgi:Uma2 family endonuclease
MAQATLQRWTYEDLKRLPDDGQRYEIIGGRLHVTPAPWPRHQKIVGELFYRIREYLVAHPVGEVYLAPVDVRVGEADTVQPDLAFIALENLDIVGERSITGAPDLVVEVASESTQHYDATTKRDAYEAAGVQEYWRVDANSDSVSVLRREGQGFGPESRLDRGSTLTTPLLPGFALRVDQILVR